jgi:hypothetical protein
MIKFQTIPITIAEGALARKVKRNRKQLLDGFHIYSISSR